MKKVAGPLRINLAQFRELEAFAEFGSDLDEASQAQLDRGRRVVEMLKQPQYQPVTVEDQVVTLFAVTEGYFDKVPVDEIPEAESGLLEYIRTRHGDLLENIKTSGDLPEDGLKDAVVAFVKTITKGDDS